MRTLGNLHAVHAVIGPVAAVSIKHILANMSARAEITVRRIADIIVELAVFAAVNAQGGEGDIEEQVLELLEKRDVEVVVPAKGERVKSITVPKILFANFILRVRREDRNNISPGDVALSPVQISLIAKAHSPLLTALGT